MKPMQTQFKKDMEAAGFKVHKYAGRSFYFGYAVIVEAEQEQNVIRATSVRLRSDHMGKNGLVIYPTVGMSETEYNTIEE